jgi:hypothetical protein
MILGAVSVVNSNRERIDNPAYPSNWGRGVFAALDAGSIDVPKARVFSEWTGGLTGEQARNICVQPPN